MFTSIRRYRVRRGSAAKLARRVQDGFVPLVRQIKGFRGYYLLDGGPDVLITISMFDTADEALASNEKAADWVRNNVLEFTRGMPEVMVGDSDRRGQVATLRHRWFRGAVQVETRASANLPQQFNELKKCGTEVSPIRCSMHLAAPRPGDDGEAAAGARGQGRPG
jgi:hypothetical protein